MKQLTEITRVNGYLVKIFNLLNARYFDNTLSKPVITIQSTPRAYGHVTIGKVWENGNEERNELNIGAGTLNRPIENVVATMLHEMVHLFCMQNNIKDTSRGYAYHNKRFKEQAEKRDLQIEHSPAIGWSVTTPTDALIQFCLDNDLEEIRLFRQEASPFYSPTGTGSPSPTPTAPPKAPSSTRKMICPKCGNSARVTKSLSLICGDCYKATQAIIFLELCH